ncbi:hypothetical protein [Coraliomargarita parva]|uniref:hypothetical protein n=1 Tax=Coraliomargarita parva TaxID=3014050 RepID=UPI0022B2B9DA|nr:hypothetical protein [Coraliomargarita parva]
MAYHLRLSNIHPDYSIETHCDESWTAEVDSNEDFCMVLNRVAIATSLTPAVEIPEVEVTYGTKRVHVTSIGGELFYSDLNSQSRQNVKVVADEVVQLLHNTSWEDIFNAREEEEEAGPRPVRYRKSGLGPFVKSLFLLVLAGVTVFSFYSVWRTLSDQPSLVAIPDFTPAPVVRSRSLLSEWSGVYVSEYREGAQVFELKRTGNFSLYEIWSSHASGKNILVPVRESPARAGLHGDQLSILAGEKDLMVPLGEQILKLHGVSFTRHYGPLSQLGEIKPVFE